jgi:hypothetical protein
MARGVPSILSRRGRKKARPPVDRNAHVYRDLRKKDEAPAEAPKKSSTAKPANAKAKAKASTPAPAPAPAPAPVKAAAPAPAPEPAPEPKVETKPAMPDVSMDNTRAELDEAAKSVGIENPEKLGKKQNVLDAIIAATS